MVDAYPVPGSDGKRETAQPLSGLPEEGLIGACFFWQEPKHLARLMASDGGLVKDPETCTVVPVINMVDDVQSLQLPRQAAELALARTDRFDRVILASVHDAERPVAAVVER